MIILNEREYAERCIRNREIQTSPYQSLVIIANYYYFVCNLHGKKLSSSVTDFFAEVCFTQYESDTEYWDEVIKSVVKHAGTYPLHEINGVWITKGELEKIKSLENKALEKLAFTLLCLAKYSNLRNKDNSYWVSYDYKEIFKLARVTCSRNERYVRMRTLYQCGFIELAKRIDNLNVRVTYAEPESAIRGLKSGDIFIDDFRELGYEYLYATGESFVRCAECGRLTRNNKNGTKTYCSNCVAYTPQEIKILICDDCGKPFKVSAKNNKSHRCEKCQRIKEKALNTLRKRRQREVMSR